MKKKNNASPRKSRSRLGQIEQDKVTASISQLAGKLSEILGSEFVKVEVEPIINKLTIVLTMGFDSNILSNINWCKLT